MMDILVPSIPAPYRITQTMWEDFIWDPVLMVKVVFGYELDAFQACRLRYYWFCPQCIDSSGTGSGKSIVDWCWVNGRAVLFPEREIGVYYPVFSAGKGIFWPYYTECKSPIYLAHIGGTDESYEEGSSGRVKDAACWTASYRTGSLVSMPAPSSFRDAETQAGRDFHDELIEEWTEMENMGDAIDKQLKGRARAPVFNRNHPIWTNHIVYSAHAKTRLHKSFRRFDQHQKAIRKGNPHYANLHYCHKDFSNLTCHTGKSYRDHFRASGTIESEKLTTQKADWLGKGLGIWGISGVGWFTEEALLACQAAGSRRNVLPVTSRKQVSELVSQ